jgi:hypothetical protein
MFRFYFNTFVFYFKIKTFYSIFIQHLFLPAYFTSSYFFFLYILEFMSKTVTHLFRISTFCIVCCSQTMHWYVSVLLQYFCILLQNKNVLFSTKFSCIITFNQFSFNISLYLRTLLHHIFCFLYILEFMTKTVTHPFPISTFSTFCS